MFFFLISAINHHNLHHHHHHHHDYRLQGCKYCFALLALTPKYQCTLHLFPAPWVWMDKR